MSKATNKQRRKIEKSVFRMPTMTNLTSRISSITNAFANALLPGVVPSPEEIDEALQILGMDADNVRCAYCGDPSSEWDHLRPTVLDLRPTGFIAEIANLVPACGKCNQSKGNKPWRQWMLSNMPRSPSRRGVPAIAEKMARLEAFERWRVPTQIDFVAVIGEQAWEEYWENWKLAIEDIRRCQKIAGDIREKAKPFVAKNAARAGNDPNVV